MAEDDKVLGEDDVVDADAIEEEEVDDAVVADDDEEDLPV